MTTKKRFMSILLSLVMVLGLVPGIGMTAYAAGEKAYTAYDVTTDANKEKSGNDLTDLQVTFNGKKWYIIEDNSTAVNAGTVTLLAAESFGGSKFHDNSNKYSTSTIKTTLDNMTVSDGSFADVASAIDTVKVKGSESDAEVDAKLYLLSEGEAGPLPVNVKQFSNFWWLRSPNPDGGSSARCVDSSSGDVQNADVDAVWILVRPALKLNLSSVIFSSESNSFTLKPAHTHSFSYSASGATITATCTAEECTLTSNPTLTIVAPTLTYVGQTGTDISASATLDGLDAFNAATGANLAVTNIKYVGRDGTTYEESETAPTAGGKYTAKITLSGVKTSEGENKSVTASVDYSIKVTLTFNSNGGSEIARQVLDVDECPTEPAEPTNGAYYFGGWYEDEIFENGFAFQPITQNKTVYAKWGEHEVKWVIGGYFRREVFTGAVPAADSSSEVNTILSLLIDDMGPLSGATFIEWKTVTDQIGNVTHTAQLSFPVTLHANEGTISAGDISSYMVGTGVTLPTDVTREGYRFGGWYDNSECTGTAVTQISATNTGSKEYWAKWDAPISRTVTFKVVNGKWDDETTADKTVPLNGYEGDTLKLTADQIPEVGSYPNTGYKAGSWDVTPSTDTAITNATTYTYTYAQKEKAVVAKAPTGKKLSHSGQSKELVTAGEATGGTMYYALGEDETTAPATSAFSEAVPTGTDIGTYYVWYIAKGDENHQDSTPACVIATISENEGKASFVNKDNSSNITGVDQDVIRDQMQEIAEADATDPQEGQTKSVTVTLETKAVPADEVPQEEKKAIDKEMKTSIPDTYAETVQSDFLEISVDKIVIIYENSSNGDKEEKSNIKSSLKELQDVVDIPV
uniref:InlB B-repeat-containing protein n=1 Tax=Eubacterium cellulosolvens TaxID=29322 RepID=UPI000488BB0E